MFRDGFLRFCDDPDLACCRAEKELEKLRIENGQLYAEIEKLQAQLESLRCTSCGEIPAMVSTDDGQYCEKCAEELDVVEMIDLLNYHNPADVEALEKARGALKAIKQKYIFEPNTVQTALDEALASISEVLP